MRPVAYSFYWVPSWDLGGLAESFRTHPDGKFLYQDEMQFSIDSPIPQLLPMGSKIEFFSLPRGESSDGGFLCFIVVDHPQLQYGKPGVELELRIRVELFSTNLTPREVEALIKDRAQQIFM